WTSISTRSTFSSAHSSMASGEFSENFPLHRHRWTFSSTRRPSAWRNESWFGAPLTSETVRPDRVRQGEHLTARGHELRAHESCARRDVERGVPRGAVHRAPLRGAVSGDELEARAGAVAHLHGHAAGASAIRLEVQLRAARRRGDE